MKKLITGVFVTSVALVPLAARADWDDLKQRGNNLEQQGKQLENKGQSLEERGKELKAKGESAEGTAKSDYDKGKVVEKKSVTTYKKGRNYAKTTVQYYIQAVERFAKHFHRPPDQLNQTHLREYQAYLLRDRKLEPRTVKLHVSALRFFFVKTLKRPYMLDDIPYPKIPRRLPMILTVDEVTRLIDAARTLTDRTMLMVLYSTGMRNAEMRSLHVKDIDSRAMLIHIQRGKGGRDRYVPLSPTLLDWYMLQGDRLFKVQQSTRRDDSSSST